VVPPERERNSSRPPSRCGCNFSPLPQDRAREGALEVGRLFALVAARGPLQAPDGAEESTEEPTVGPYRAGEGRFITWLISNLPNLKKCLAQIGDEAGRHCGDVVGIGWIGFVAVRAWCARSAAPAGTITQERAISMIFANPASIVAPGAVPHRRARSTKGKSMSVQALGSKGFALR
jgi:hypothetical protein